MKSYINIAHLKFFCDTVTYNSMSEAAKMNYITQSAISQAINKLEVYFGVPLLIHNNQGVVMTEHGKIVFNQALEVFKTLNDTSSQICQINDKIVGDVRFVTTKSLGMSFFPSTYPKSKKNLPHVNINIDMGGRNHIRNVLKLEEVEFAIVVYDDHNYPQFAKKTLKKGFFNLYCSKLGSSDINTQEIFIDREGSLYIEDLRKFLIKNHYTPQTKGVNGWELSANLVNSGIGLGFFPDFLASKFPFQNLIPHPITLPPFEYEIAVIYNKSTKLSRLANAFIEQFTMER